MPAFHDLDDAAVDHLAGAELLDALAAQFDAALGDLAALASQQVAHRAQRGRLAGTVAAQDGDHAALGHLQAHALEHQDDVVVDDLDAVDVEQDVAHVWPGLGLFEHRARCSNKGPAGPLPVISSGSRQACGGVSFFSARYLSADARDQGLDDLLVGLQPVGRPDELAAVPGVHARIARAQVIGAARRDRAHHTLEAQRVELGLREVQVLVAPAGLFAGHDLALAEALLRGTHAFHGEHGAHGAAHVQHAADFFLRTRALALGVDLLEDLLDHRRVAARRRAAS